MKDLSPLSGFRAVSHRKACIFRQHCGLPMGLQAFGEFWFAHSYQYIPISLNISVVLHFRDQILPALIQIHYLVASFRNQIIQVFTRFLNRLVSISYDSRETRDFLVIMILVKCEIFDSYDSREM